LAVSSGSTLITGARGGEQEESAGPARGALGATSAGRTVGGT
jgi:hypothetical protein